jgi:hypothetical protein
MPEQKRKLILITGIPGTGKTWYGNFFAQHYGFVHRNVEEEPGLLQRLCDDPPDEIGRILNTPGDVVVTWGFVPGPVGTDVVNKFRDKRFKLVWFDGDRPAALRAYIKRGSPEELFYLQMYRIENSKAVQLLAPLVVKTIDENGEFKPPEAILEEIAKG